MAEQSEWAVRVIGWLDPARDTALGWITSPAAWVQFALLGVALLAAVLVSRRLAPVLARLITPAAGQETHLAASGRFALMLMPMPACGFTAAGEEVTRTVFGSGDVIAFGKRLFVLLAARIIIRDVLHDPFCGSPALFAIWNALKAEGTEMPCPRRAVKSKGAMPQVGA